MGKSHWAHHTKFRQEMLQRDNPWWQVTNLLAAQNVLSLNACSYRAGSGHCIRGISLIWLINMNNTQCRPASTKLIIKIMITMIIKNNISNNNNNNYNCSTVMDIIGAMDAQNLIMFILHCIVGNICLENAVKPIDTFCSFCRTSNVAT